MCGCGSKTKPEVSHCSGATPLGGQSQCHASQCHMVIMCHVCETESYAGCRTPSHEGLGWGMRPYGGVL